MLGKFKELSCFEFYLQHHLRSMFRPAQTVFMYLCFNVMLIICNKHSNYGSSGKLEHTHAHFPQKVHRLRQTTTSTWDLGQTPSRSKKSNHRRGRQLAGSGDAFYSAFKMSATLTVHCTEMHLRMHRTKRTKVQSLIKNGNQADVIMCWKRSTNNR